ncbi:hypothetical protein Zm00014a_002179 [Zea mays]|uniref:Uncharacterized protein n=2 Tax=Zea mays TaxID=4577 RepID=A0A3L6FHI6_MAIZE|nr:uncharacterized protein LOC103650226 [Zea mays]ONM32192.1 hypothetical protein ZEAMMB73_Zm00001d040905 [Zea mays]PWZ32704.1 hypothetical protein Zm00014a_002179 [Zea mays]|eukprot:XP_008674063.1 uncharacterized protein LOC103650226 [Zea mays]
MATAPWLLLSTSCAPGHFPRWPSALLHRAQPSLLPELLPCRTGAPSMAPERPALGFLLASRALVFSPVLISLLVFFNRRALSLTRSPMLRCPSSDSARPDLPCAAPLLLPVPARCPEPQRRSPVYSSPWHASSFTLRARSSQLAQSARRGFSPHGAPPCPCSDFPSVLQPLSSLPQPR